MTDRTAGIEVRPPAAFDRAVVESGVDVVAISRFSDLRERADVDVVGRAFTDDEISYCEGAAHPAEHYAGRWCVKEAVRKILDRPGRVPFRAIAVRKDGPEPVLDLHEAARAEFERTIGAKPTDERVDTSISVSHDRTSDAAVGVVTVLRCD